MKKGLICLIVGCMLLTLSLSAQTAQSDPVPEIFKNGRYTMEIISVDMQIELIIDGDVWTYLLDGEKEVDIVAINYETCELVFPAMNDFASVFSFKETEQGVDLFFAEASIFKMLDYSIIFGGTGEENSVTVDAREIFQKKVTDALTSMPVIRLVRIPPPEAEAVL